MEDQEYNDLFKKVNNDKNEWQSLNETPKYNEDYKSINETPDLSQYQIKENVNDGWGNLDIQIETRINGVPQNNNPYQQQPRRNRNKYDPNGLSQYIDDENLNEVYRQPITQQPIIEHQPILESLQNVDVVSVALFEKINEQAFVSLSKYIK